MERCLPPRICRKVVFPEDEGPIIDQCSFLEAKDGSSKLRFSKRGGLAVVEGRLEFG